ncbi:C10 family peptidase [Xylanibacter oryzae]|uniref:C10 family peptidase n=1 Tax=Xylanibacter oryzae TaxID=185293 RepID=UPI0004B4A84D|nr:C10 family peptidase [Xylanibacter oryzae]
MKTLERKILFLILAAIGLISCNQEDQLSVNNPSDHENKVTIEEAKANVMDFIANMNKGTRAFPSNVSIANVEAISLPRGTRASSNVNLDTLFYVVNFKDSCGFAIASTDDREKPILALVEKGNYSYNEADTTNAGFNAFIDGMIEKEIGAKGPRLRIDTDDESGGSSTSIPDKFEVMSPLLTTKWDQRSPYNKYCPGSFTGCVITAISQICSYIGMPSSRIKYSYNNDQEVGEATMNWAKINNECKESGGYIISADATEQVARLMRFWGGVFDANYTNGGTSADTGDAIYKMRRFYGFDISGLNDYDIDNVISDLKKGNRIILMRGDGRYYHVGFVFKQYVDGHAWVIDGYINQVKNDKESKYVHCNWGWGGDRNGYFLSDVLNAEQDPVYDDGAKSTTRSEDYRYKLKTATFIK